MTYTNKQLDAAMALMSGIEEYLNELSGYQANNYPTGLALSHDPKMLDKLLNYHRIKDMCFIYLIDHTQGPKLMPYLEEQDANTIQTFLDNHDPIDCVNFFSKDNVINDYIKAQEFDIDNAFLKDSKFDPTYQQFLKNGSVISNPAKP